MRTRVRCNLLVLITLALLSAGNAKAYSVLTHEAVIDVAWDKSILPILKQRYPQATAEQLKDAHAYAYGGCVVPDMGYYPFGCKLFTELTHYVRTGAFIQALFDEAQNINEYAFALGALSHYNSDKYGHPIGTNRAVAVAYPEAKEKFGSVVTYEQDPLKHVRTEFGFDVLQTARGNYAGATYHDFIGFKIARPSLERAFLKTYGLDMNDLFKDLNRTIETYRWIIKNLFPTITRTAWAAKKGDIRKANPGMRRRKFEYRMKKANYYHEFGKKHDKPGLFPNMMAAMIKVLPKVGPLKDFKVKIPDSASEDYFIKSFDTTIIQYTACLKKIQNSTLNLQDIDFDTGKDTWQGEYGLADENYIILLLKLKEKDFKTVNAGLKQNLTHFYNGCDVKIAARAGVEQWEKITVALDELKRLDVK